MPAIPTPTSVSASGGMATQRNVMINFKGSVTNLVASTKSATAELTKMGTSVANMGKMFTSVLKGDVRPLVNGIFSAIGKLASLFLLMPGFLLALVNPVNVAHMAMANFSSAISAANPADFVAATRNMAPAMRDAVMSVRLLEPQLKNLYGIVQQGFWAGFSKDVDDLARVYFPVLGQGLGGIATGLGNLREQFVQFLLKPQVVAAIQSWMAAFSGLGAPILHMVETLMPSLIQMFTAFATILTNFVIPAITTITSLVSRLVTFITPLLSGLAGISGGLGTGGTSSSTTSGGGGFFSSLISSVGSFFGGLFGGGRAEGGPISPGRSYLVGERGPEILSMGGSGFVHPNSSIGSGNTMVVVKIGETELRDIVATQVTSNYQSTALMARMGRGVIV